ncbi:MAG TPA: hypothetical protein VM513_30685, partial [Kofleriaceae bacterium]|nr:hypothetical protein [Kofleriaceae bacterium]
MRSPLMVVVALGGCASAHGEGPADASFEPPDQASIVTPPDVGCIEDCNPLALYVARSGSDTAPGTKHAPMLTIPAAIAKAHAIGAIAVYVQGGTYPETVVMKGGVGVYGGFDDAWLRAAASVTLIEAAAPAVAFDGINAPTRLDGVTIKSVDAVGTGASSYAVAVTGSTQIELVDVTILAGAGAPGSDGFDGVAGAFGSAGGPGKPGVERSTSTFCDFRPLPAGGSGGTSSCGRSGGFGGTPGTGASGGSPGISGIGGTAGGLGASSSSRNGSPGSNGAIGIAGSSG